MVSGCWPRPLVGTTSRRMCPGSVLRSRKVHFQNPGLSGVGRGSWYYDEMGRESQDEELRGAFHHVPSPQSMAIATNAMTERDGPSVLSQLLRPRPIMKKTRIPLPGLKAMAQGLTWFLYVAQLKFLFGFRPSTCQMKGTTGRKLRWSRSPPNPPHESKTCAHSSWARFSFADHFVFQWYLQNWRTDK